MKLPIHTTLVDLKTGEPMVLDQSKKVKAADGTEKDLPARHWTLGLAIGEAMMGDYMVVKDGKIAKDDDGKPEVELLTPEQRVKRFTLAQRMYTTLVPDEPDVTSEEIVLIKRLLNNRFDTAISGQAIFLIEKAGG